MLILYLKLVKKFSHNGGRVLIRFNDDSWKWQTIRPSVSYMEFEMNVRTDGQTDAGDRIWCICDIFMVAIILMNVLITDQTSCIY